MLRRGENEQRTRLLSVSGFFALCTVVPECAQSPWVVFRTRNGGEMDPYHKGVQASVCL